MNRLRWYAKQLFPMRYSTVSRPVVNEVAQGTQFVTWRMWFGRCFNVQRTAV